MKAYLEQMGILNPKAVYRNLAPAELVEHALERGEGKLCSTGAFVINTGKYTGRSPDDRFIVDEPSVHNLIDWGKVNVPISSEKADAIYVKMCAYMQNREVLLLMALSVQIRNMRFPFVLSAKTQQAHCLQLRHLFAPQRSSSILSFPVSPFSAHPDSSVPPLLTA